jgi:hypothetical protein
MKTGNGPENRPSLYQRVASWSCAMMLAVSALIGVPAAPVFAAACHHDAPPTLPDYISDEPTRTTRLTCSTEAAIYGDDGVLAMPSSQIRWVAPFVENLWRYIKREYGSCAVRRELSAPIGPGCEEFGTPKPLIVFLISKGGGGTIALRFDEFSGFRNTVWVSDQDWNVDNGVLRDVLVHEACHIVEGGGQGVHESPAFEVWGDSKWAEFCMYDFYVNTGRAYDAKRIFNEFMGQRDNLPEGARNVAWFRDWFFPLWEQSGRNAQVMHRFFRSLSQRFPTRLENGGQNLIYSRRMTTGEFVHFMSGAAGKDLSARASAAFGTGYNPAQFNNARRDFPITYNRQSTSQRSPAVSSTLSVHSQPSTQSAGQPSTGPRPAFGPVWGIIVVGLAVAIGVALLRPGVRAMRRRRYLERHE